MRNLPRSTRYCRKRSSPWSLSQFWERGENEGLVLRISEPVASSTFSGKRGSSRPFLSAYGSRSVVEHELAGVQQRPEQVFIRLLLRSRAVELAESRADSADRIGAGARARHSLSGALPRSRCRRRRGLWASGRLNHGFTRRVHECNPAALLRLGRLA